MLMPPIKGTEQSKASQADIPAPVKGMNTAQEFTKIEPGYARLLDNWVCRTDGLHVREGHTVVASGLSGPVTSLLDIGGTVLGCTSTRIYSGTTVQQTAASGDWQSAQLTNGGGLWLVAANGASGGYFAYNGSTWIIPTIDGLDPADIVGLCVHHNRVWLVERGSLRVWYLPLFSFGGTARPVYLQQLCRKGGTVTAIATISQDGGRNSNDQLAIVTDQGELVLWNGSDPDNSASWALGGVYNVPLPVGRKCFTSHAGGLAYLSTLGLMRIPDELGKPDEDKRTGGLSDAIWPTLSEALASGDWSVTSSIEHELLIVSGPTYQYVRSGTDAWSRLSGLNATSWLSAGGELYFGTSDGKVCLYGGDDDNGTAISSFIVDRFETFGKRTTKTVHQVRPLYSAAQPYRPRIEILTNYQEPPSSFPAHWTDSANWNWDEITWSRQPMPWTRSTSHRLNRWRGVKNGHGKAFALMMGMKTKTPVIYTGAELMVEG